MQRTQSNRKKRISKCSQPNNPYQKISLEHERKRVMKARRAEFIKEALRARKFTGAQSLEMGCHLIDCALELVKVGRDARNSKINR